MNHATHSGEQLDSQKKRCAILPISTAQELEK
jgi:hypothetical protein